MSRLWSHLLLPLLGAVHAALQVLQQAEHLLDLSLGVGHNLDHVLQLHHTLIRFFLKSKNLSFLYGTFSPSGKISPRMFTYNGVLDILDILPHLLHLTLQLFWRLHNLALEFADVLLQGADVDFHLSLRRTMSARRQHFC